LNYRTCPVFGGHYIVSVFAVLVLLLSATSGIVRAQEPPPDTESPLGIGPGEIPPWVHLNPSNVERVVSRSKKGSVSSLSLCDTMWWDGYTHQTGWYEARWEHRSQSRAESDHSYPCDIDKIGVRGRAWINNDLEYDSKMQKSPNSADKVVEKQLDNVFCWSSDIYARSNHYFEEAGIGTWEPTTDNSC